MEWDVFISHASEDKEAFVKPLAILLDKLGVKVWYDEFTLELGDSLSKSIDKGLIKSQYGLIVISKSFMIKGWTDYELRGLISREVGQGKVILPIWYNVTKEDVLNFSPTLADKIAICADNKNMMEIVMDILKVIRLDIYDNVNRTVIAETLRRDTPKELEDITKINNPRKIRHNTLSKTLMARIQVMNRILWEVYPVSIDETIFNFKCEPNPEREMQIWEAITATYLEYLHQKKEPLDVRKDVFWVVLKLSLEVPKQAIYTDAEFLDSKQIDEITKLYRNFAPSFSTAIGVTKSKKPRKRK